MLKYPEVETVWKEGKMIKQITSHHSPNSFEICEKLMHQKLSEHFDSVLSPI